jgi:hypothetical protein
MGILVFCQLWGTVLKGKAKVNLRTVGDLAAPLPRGQLVKETRLLAELAAALTGAFRTRNPSINSDKIQSEFA